MSGDRWSKLFPLAGPKTRSLGHGAITYLIPFLFSGGWGKRAMTTQQVFFLDHASVCVHARIQQFSRYAIISSTFGPISDNSLASHYEVIHMSNIFIFRGYNCSLTKNLEKKVWLCPFQFRFCLGAVWKKGHLHPTLFRKIIWNTNVWNRCYLFFQQC